MVFCRKLNAVIKNIERNFAVICLMKRLIKPIYNIVLRKGYNGKNITGF
jgi:hypothetical protein